MTAVRPLIIAEAGVNHCGDLTRARRMVLAAADAGADYVKFQAFKTDEIVAETAETAAYQKSRTGEDRQSDLLRTLELSLDDFRALYDECHAAGIGFLCTPFDVDMLEGLVAMGMDLVKVPSGELTNSPYLRRVAQTGLPILLSTGMATLAEVRTAITALRNEGATDITALHCTSLYPAPIETVNLRAMATMRDELDVPVGYSDHSLGDHVAVGATALGATVIEKHFTLGRTLPGPDQAASLEPAELALLVRRVRETARALGDGVKAPVEAELGTARLVRRSWHAARDLSAGAVLGQDDITLKRPADGLPPGESPVGRAVLHPVAADSPLRPEDLTEAPQ